MPPLVSVIIPTYNRATFLGRAVRSVVAQTFEDFEVLVVDDGSQDDTAQLIASFTDFRVRYLYHPANLGGACARNTGINASQGAFVAFLDSDDEWLPHKLERQVNFFCSTSDAVGAVYSLYYVERFTRRQFPATALRGNLYHDFLRGWCPSLTSSMMIRREVFLTSGLFDESLPSFQDYDLWIRIARDWKFDFLDDHLVIVHQHDGPRVGRDFEPRTKGLELFLHKWGKLIRSNSGHAAVQNLRRQYLSNMYRDEALMNLASRNWSRAGRPLSRLIGLRGIHPGFLANALIACFGGKRLLALFFRIYDRIRKPSLSQPVAARL